MFGSQAPGTRPAPSGPISSNVKIVGGNQQLPLAIARSLPEECIKFNHQLVSIKRNSYDSVTLSFATPNGLSDLTCDHVVLALPFSTLRLVDYQQSAFVALN